MTAMGKKTAKPMTSTQSLQTTSTQRAAKKILKLKLELGCRDHFGDPVRQFQESRMQESKKPGSPLSHTTTTKSASRGESNTTTRKLSLQPSSPAKKSESRTTKPSAQTREGIVAAVDRGPGTNSSSSKPLSSQPPSVKKEKRLETKEQRELRELHEKQQRLAAWLTSNTSSREKDDVVAYSIETESRIHHAMESSRDIGLWGDPVDSLIASEMTSESVFGGFIPTRRLAFPLAVSEPNSTTGSAKQPVLESHDRAEDLANSDDDNVRIEIPVDETSSSSSLITERALEIRQEAQELVQAGNIEDALATLQDGIKQLLFDFQDNQDEIQETGFNFSQDAHKKASAVQLRYKARHRKRVEKIAFLQRMWRNYQVEQQFLETKRSKSVNARVIQRHYKQRFFRIQRIKAATRIQNCFRIFQEQKHWICLHRACRMLVNGERKKRERIREYQAMKKRLWCKLATMLRMLWLWKSRCRALTQIQRHWRGSRARVEYAKLLAAQCEVEKSRLSWELAFVNPRLDQAMALYHQFLEKTRVGKQLVRWQMEKPWLRFKRLRQERGIWFELDLKTKVQAICGLLLENRPVVGLDDGATPVLSSRSKPARFERWLSKRTVMLKNWIESAKLILSRQLLLVYWHLAFCPLSYVIDRNSPQNRQRAVHLLEKQQRFARIKHLRLVCRQLDPKGKDNRPSLACQYCSEPFATALAHM